MVKDVTPLPDQDVICLDIARVKICSKIDLSDAYEQIHIIPEDVHKTVFTTIYRTFVSNVMQQGNCNMPSMFQRTMNSVFHEYIRIFLHMYLDNLFICSNLVQEHQKHLGMVFKKLREHELYLREEKCKLFTAKVNCLGHMIDEKGLHANANKMAKIRDWNRLCNFKDIQRFLGLVQYLAHFLPDITSYTGPLASMTMNGTPFYWKPLHKKCFQMIKAICRPAGFMSRKFTDAQHHY